MTNTYFINNDLSSITIKVTISTPGFAVSKIDKEIQASSTEDIAGSPVDGIGDVPETIIGNANMLNNCIIETDTIIELQDIVPQEEWQSCFKNLVCTYIFTGGSHGTQTFNCDPDDKKNSTSGTIITVSKRIQLVNK